MIFARENIFVGRNFLNPPRSIENFTGFPTAPFFWSGKCLNSSYGQNTDFPTPLWEGVGGEAPRAAGAGGGGAAKKLAKTEKNRIFLFFPNRSQIVLLSLDWPSDPPKMASGRGVRKKH